MLTVRELMGDSSLANERPEEWCRPWKHLRGFFFFFFFFVFCCVAGREKLRTGFKKEEDLYYIYEIWLSLAFRFREDVSKEKKYYVRFIIGHKHFGNR